MKRTALIIGHTGQDGSYLSELLEQRSYQVYGISSHHLLIPEEGLKIKQGSITDPAYCDEIIQTLKPDEIYYLAAVHQSSIEKSHDDLPFNRLTIDVNANGLMNVLNSVLMHSKTSKVFFASSSHVFSGSESQSQSETTPYKPISIYGISKILGMNYAELYREKGVFCSCGIFYNHESPRRDSKFVTKKIVETAVSILNGEAEELVLGDLGAKIDWGYAPDYMLAAHLMLQLNEPEDFIVSSGKLHTVKDFVEITFNYLKLDWQNYVRENKGIILKRSVTVLQGDNSKLKSLCNWSPSVTFKEMVELIVMAELKKRGLSLKNS
ncbi:MAG TPA: GDP-mannose 4,6-dehydratase [Bacteroidia bacterium]